MPKQTVSIILRDEIGDVDNLTSKKAVDYVRRALDAYQTMARISIYKVRASKLEESVPSASHNTASAPCEGCIYIKKCGQFDPCDECSRKYNDNYTQRT